MNKTLGVLPVTEQKATREGEHEEDDCEDQFKFLIFVFVGKPEMMKWRWHYFF